MLCCSGFRHREPHRPPRDAPGTGSTGRWVPSGFPSGCPARLRAAPLHTGIPRFENWLGRSVKAGHPHDCPALSRHPQDPWSCSPSPYDRLRGFADLSSSAEATRGESLVPRPLSCPSSVIPLPEGGAPLRAHGFIGVHLSGCYGLFYGGTGGLYKRQHGCLCNLTAAGSAPPARSRRPLQGEKPPGFSGAEKPGPLVTLPTLRKLGNVGVVWPRPRPSLPSCPLPHLCLLLPLSGSVSGPLGLCPPFSVSLRGSVSLFPAPPLSWLCLPRSLSGCGCSTLSHPVVVQHLLLEGAREPQSNTRARVVPRRGQSRSGVDVSVHQKPPETRA